MHRSYVLDSLQSYRARNAAEGGCVDRFIQFVQARPDCFLRSCRTGHVTGSAWVTTPDATRAVLVHHGKLERWLQPGGHADGEPQVYRTALREVQEETGLWESELFVAADGGVPLLDVDIHPIPAHGDDQEHLHYDLRYWVRAKPSAQPRASGESREVRWVDAAALHEFTDEESVLRLAAKVQALANG